MTTLRAHIDSLLDVYKDEACYEDVQDYLNHMYTGVTLTRFLSIQHDVPHNPLALVEELLSDECDVIYTPNFHLYPRKNIEAIINASQEREGAPPKVTLH